MRKKRKQVITLRARRRRGLKATKIIIYTTKTIIRVYIYIYIYIFILDIKIACFYVNRCVYVFRCV